ncbi:alpha/beta hydrolase family protein [Streptomyces marianii]|uniref:Peptidase S9 prolyl oligopeptidase catalytic domain-containing protein n=1 Tax=Streptomyces marianii TaxID=1817406 RepID=A0A5R9E181_9ACTN|nr:prolyl oligopeptidase family serine peptidase [Streptomyces marianii]TLQ43157.1 hypothetical protein FEF34_08385 [Streptomyces marianii]
MADEFDRTRQYRRHAPDGRASLLVTSAVHPSADERNPAAVQWRGLTADPALAGLVPGRARPQYAEVHTEARSADGWRLPVPHLLPVAPAWHPWLPLLAGLAVDARKRTAYLWTADYSSRSVRTYEHVPAATGLTALGPPGCAPVVWLDDGRIALLTKGAEPEPSLQDAAREWRPVSLEAIGPNFITFEPGEDVLLRLAGATVTVLDPADGVASPLTSPLLIRQLSTAAHDGLLLDHVHPAHGAPDEHGLCWSRSHVSPAAPGRLRPAPAAATAPVERATPQGPVTAYADQGGEEQASAPPLRHALDTGFGQAQLTVLPEGDGTWLLWIRALRQGEGPSPGTPTFLTGAGHSGAVLDLPLYWPGDADPKLIHDQITTAVEGALALLGDMRPGRVVVGGHSFGATLALYSLAYLEGLAGAMAHSGCYNRTLTPTGFHYERRTLWAAPEMYRAFSALQFANRLDRPVLLVHGTEDANAATPSDQAVELYRAVVATGGHARLVLIPGEGHTFHSREALRAVAKEHHDWLERC